MLHIFISILILSLSAPLHAQSTCGEHGVWLQVLGSGGPELQDQRASSGYVIWHNAKARILLDMGGGSLLRFEQSGASPNDLDVLLFTHFHVDHSSDLPALIMATYFSDRDRNLPLYGPTGNALMPSATEFVQGLFGERGVYRYLQDYLDGSGGYRLIPHDVEAAGKLEKKVWDDGQYQITAIPVHHGPIPAIAWRVTLGGKTIVFSGDMNNDNGTLATLAKQADLLVAHHAIPEEAGKVARNLHMPPSVIGQIAAQAGVKQLVLSHRMLRTIGKEEQSLSRIKRDYSGPVYFADDLQCFHP